ncbi:MAG: DUF2975 domain-containing protein [Methylococcaceae bacterium]|jgi:hypothetical protein
MKLNADTKLSFQRICWASRILALACLWLIFCLPVAVAFYWLWADAVSLAVRVNLPPNGVEHGLLAWQRLTGCVLTEISLVFLLMGVWQARQCFKLFTHNKLFTRQAVSYLKHFAAWAALSAVAEIITKALISVVLTYENLAGMRHVAIGIGSDQIFLLFFAGMVWLMASVINEGQLLAEENASFI